MAFCTKTLGGGEVILSGHHDDRLALARQFGASVTINTRETALTEAVASRYPHGLPLVIDAVGHNPILQDGLDLLAPEGKIGVYGFSDRRAAMLDWSRAPCSGRSNTGRPHFGTAARGPRPLQERSSER
jgi:L-iditol 2-dehydrogenase